MECEDGFSETDREVMFETQLYASLILPLYFIKGVFVWIGVFALWVYVLYQGFVEHTASTKKVDNGTLFGNNNRVGRSLSDAVIDDDVHASR